MIFQVLLPLVNVSLTKYTELEVNELLLQLLSDLFLQKVSKFQLICLILAYLEYSLHGMSCIIIIRTALD